MFQRSSGEKFQNTDISFVIILNLSERFLLPLRNEF